MAIKATAQIEWLTPQNRQKPYWHKTALLFSGQSDIVAARFNDRKAWMARVASIKYYINHIYRAFFSIFSNAKAGGNKAIGECINEF